MPMNPDDGGFICAACGSVSSESRSSVDYPIVTHGERWRTYMFPYQVSDHGRVRNIVTSTILKPSIRPPMGYRAYTLRIDRSRRVDRYLHRMVLETFVGPGRPGDHGRHLNGDPSDNRLSNLAWGTPKENKADDLRLGRRMRGERQHRAKLTEAAAREIKNSDETKEELAERFGVHPETVGSVRRGLSWAWVV